VGTTCTCTLILDGGESQVRIRAAGVVMRHVDNGMAIRFDELLDAESYDHLCQLIRYNALDPEKLSARSRRTLGSNDRRCERRQGCPQQQHPDQVAGVLRLSGRFQEFSVGPAC